MFGVPDYCQVLPPSAHTIKATASKFLLNWLFQYEHEHRQWSAAISLGFISCCLHVTDHRQKFQNITGLVKVWRSVAHYPTITKCFESIHLKKALQNKRIFIYFLLSGIRREISWFFHLWCLIVLRVCAFRFCVAAKVSLSKEHVE